MLAGLPEFRTSLRLRVWPLVDCLVEGVDESVHRLRGDGPPSEGIEYRVKYGYVVDGRAWVGRWNSVISSRHRPGGCPFTVGQLVDVFYDPVNPTSARLFRGVRFQDLVLVVCGVVFLLGALLPIGVYFALKG
jgi:hypothetical protein